MEGQVQEAPQENVQVPVQQEVVQNVEAPVEQQPEEVKTTQQLVEEQEKDFFKTSQFEQPEALRKFLEEKLANPYNKYCIDCKKNQTTHAIIWLGAFVCEGCANMHRMSYGGNQYSYIKNVYKEHWDDYQLRSVQLGGNQPLFQIMKEYNVHELQLPQKYKQSCITWYRKKHLAAMDMTHFDAPKPPKDWDERAQMTKEQLGSAAQYAGENLSVLGGVLKVKGGAAAVVIGEKAGVLKDKIKEKQIGSKLSGFIKSKMAAKNQQNADNGPPQESAGAPQEDDTFKQGA